MITRDKFTAIVMTLFVWGLSGALFGALFAGLFQTFVVAGFSDWQPLVLAAATAAMTTSALYSAMPVALVGATAGVLASIGVLIVTGRDPELNGIAAVAGVAGLLAGSFYAWMVSGGGRPLAETLTGLVSGLAAGGVLALVFGVLPSSADMFVLAAGVVALVGALFQISERWLVAKGSGLVPGVVADALVAGLVAAVVAASIWLMSGSTASLDAANKYAIDQVLQQVPNGLLGGLLGGAVTGVLLELFGFHLEEHT